MAVIENLALAFDALSRSYRSPFRSETRYDEVRIVEYAAFPRVDGRAQAQIAFTRDVSASGLCIGSDRAETVGSLLRVVERAGDRRPDPAWVARVVWCRAAGDGRHWIGLERVTPPDPS